MAVFDSLRKLTAIGQNIFLTYTQHDGSLTYDREVLEQIQGSSYKIQVRLFKEWLLKH